MIVEEVTLGEAMFHFASIGWKIAFATVPPVKMGGGWPAFWVSLIYIGILTAIVEQVAKLFGCYINMPEAVNGITFVAIGTSLPDTFASKTAATGSEFADAAIGNITGSNSVNVFLGLGIPWLICVYWWRNNWNVPLE